MSCQAEERVPLGPQEKGVLLDQTVAQMAGMNENGMAGLKVFSYAFKDMEKAELNKILNELQQQQIPAEESEDFRAELEKELIYLSTFGLEDPLNEGIQESVDYIAHGHPDLKY